MRLVDTAGMRRRSRIDAKLEAASVADTLDTIRLADVVVVVLDAADMAEKQDLTIAGRVIDEGRALVIAVNKTDLLADDQAGASRAWRKLTDRLEASFAQVKDVPIVGFSALNGRGIDRLMPAVFTTYDIWNKRVPTPKLNRWLREMETLHPPPLAKGRRIRLRFMTQIKRRPPTFVLQVSQPEELGDDYLRYLMNRLRDDFGLPGVPIRLTMRKSKNPFAGRATDASKKVVSPGLCALFHIQPAIEGRNRRSHQTQKGAPMAEGRLGRVGERVETIWGIISRGGLACARGDRDCRRRRPGRPRVPVGRPVAGAGGREGPGRRGRTDGRDGDPADRDPYRQGPAQRGARMAPSFVRRERADGQHPDPRIVHDARWAGSRDRRTAAPAAADAQGLDRGKSFRLGLRCRRRGLAQRHAAAQDLRGR